MIDQIDKNSNKIKLNKKTNSFFERTFNKLEAAWRGIAGSTYDANIASSRPNLPNDDLELLRIQMLNCLETRGGEVKARGRAAALGHVYLALSPSGRKRFLDLLANEFGIDETSVNSAMKNLQNAISKEERYLARFDLKKSLIAPRIKLLTQFNALPDGVKFLVDMRAELISLKSKETTLLELEYDLKEILTSWFDVDFLELRQITWNNASAALLEKLIAYEAVHEIDGWDDLKNRLDSDRRCFGYFHPRMPDEPLIFVEVALVNGMEGKIENLLDEGAPVLDPYNSDTAIFYSISNAQKGLAGISFGNFLIKRVANTLSSEFNGLKTFATLSPIPGFIMWLDMKSNEELENILTNKAVASLKNISRKGESLEQSLRFNLKINKWYLNKSISEALRVPLMCLCAYYLIYEKDKNMRALDPVAHFHLTNGAQLEKINWLADISSKGIEKSASMMINYVYDLSRVESIHESYITTGEVAASSSVDSLIRH